MDDKVKAAIEDCRNNAGIALSVETLITAAENAERLAVAAKEVLGMAFYPTAATDTVYISAEDKLRDAIKEWEKQ